MTSLNLDLASGISKRHNVSMLLAKILILRGVTSPEESDSWLDPNIPCEHDPLTLKNIDSAIEWTKAAKDSGKTVWIYGDYDLDGISGTAVLVSGLNDFGIPTKWMLPNRFNGGYGLSAQTLQKMREQGAEWIILIDTGITAIEEIKTAKEFGMKVLVLDHHRPSGEGLPNADAILDPFLEDCEYLNKGLCAAGVAYKFLCALYQKTDRPVEELEKHLPLVALGTLADIVPLTKENHYLVRKGIKLLSTSKNPAISYIAQKLISDGKLINAHEIHYKMAPLLNAPGRMESPDYALEFLLSKEPEEIETLYNKLMEFNIERRKVELDIRDQVTKRITEVYGENLPSVLILDAPDWNVGVIGIVASRIAQEYKRPTAIISIQSDGTAMSSARSYGNFDWHSALFPCRDIFIRWGGHIKAAGFNMSKDKIGELRERMEEQAAVQNFSPVSEPEYSYDLEVSLSELNLNFLDELERLEPFGSDNTYPIFLSRFVKIRNPKIVGEKHLRFFAVQGYASIPSIAFNKEYLLKKIQKKKNFVDIIFEVRRNIYKGVSSVQLIIHEIL